MRLLKCCILFLVSSYVSLAYASKIQLKSGAFSLSAKSETENGSLSGFGSYQFSFNKDLTSSLELAVNYTVIMSSGIGGDMGFGFGAGFNYYPISQIGPEKYTSSAGSISISEIWRPYVGLGFQERRFQSVEANYSGFYLAGGVERQLDWHNFSLLGEFRYATMSGKNSSTATETIIYIGVSLPLGSF